MKELFFLLFLVFAATVAFILPPLLLYLSWKKTNYLKYGVTLLFLAYCFMWWRAFYPDDSYYKSKFHTISGLDLPDSAQVIHKSASYPDFHGDFSLCFVIKLEEKELRSLLTNTKVEPANEEKNCGSRKKFQLISKGRNQTDYDFMSWYVTKEGYLWGYYAQY